MIDSYVKQKQASGDNSLKFIRENHWLITAIAGDKEGADRLSSIVKSGKMPDGSRIQSVEQKWSSGPYLEVKIYLKLESDLCEIGPLPTVSGDFICS